MTTCQLCGREIKANTGKIAHHGYQRKGGWQTNSCRGARELPYEQSRDAIPAELKIIENWIANREMHLKALEKDQATVTQSKYMGFARGIQLVPVEKTDPSYKMHKDANINNVKWEIKSANKTKDWLKDRYEKWVRIETQQGQDA